MLNKAMIIGNICQDIELRQMPNGGGVATINLATNRRWKDKDSGEKKESVEYHRVCLFNRTAEIAAQYLKKGSKVYIEGRLRTQKWADAQGVDHYTTEIVAETMTMLDPIPQTGDRTHPASQHQPQPNPAQNQQQQQYGPDTGSPALPFDDDIPF